jgi:hypothetical protein
MTTKPMQIICSWCHFKTPMDQNKLWWNFDDPTWADPIGYCSEDCIMQAQARKELMRKHVVGAS